MSDNEAKETTKATDTAGRLDGLVGRLCETTLTPRYPVECSCGTYPNNLGPCLTFEVAMMDGRCVFCDHKIECHEKATSLYGTPKQEKRKALEVEIERLLNEYRCQYTQYDDSGGGSALVDILSPKDSIKEGKQEIELLAEHLSCGLSELEASGRDGAPLLPEGFISLSGKPTVRYVSRENIKDSPTKANPSPIRVWVLHEIEGLQACAEAFSATPQPTTPATVTTTDRLPGKPLGMCDSGSNAGSTPAGGSTPSAQPQNKESVRDVLVRDLIGSKSPKKEKWMNIVEEIELKFTSSNRIPVESARITAEQWAELRAKIDAKPAWKCPAGSTSGGEIIDCNWPLCGCDPHANKVMEVLQECGYLKDSNPAAVADGWMPIETAPKDTEAFFWVVPRTEQDEHWVDTAGNPILSSAKPRIFMGLNRCWSSLEKATHWCQLLAAPKVEK